MQCSGGYRVAGPAWPGRARAVLLAAQLAFASLAAATAVAADAGADGAPADARPVLIELFTSQGCSSCPPADRLLAELGNRPEVIAISFAVDYWDYLGWHDTYGSRANSARQRAYAKRMGEGMVYTPQIVIDGRRQLNGADRSAVDTAVGQRLGERRTKAGVALSLRGEGDKLRISVGGAGGDASAVRATLWMAAVDSAAEVVVRGGENRGQRLRYHNIVRDLMPISEWSGAPMQVTLPRANALMHGGDSCILILQEDDGGPVLAAARLDPR